MKKSVVVSLVSFAFLLLCSLSAYLLGGISGAEGWVMLLVGLVLLLVSGAIAVFAGESIPLNAVCFSLSSVALGFCIRAWYIFRGLDNELYTMVLVSLSAALYLFVFYSLSRLPGVRNHKAIYTAVVLLLSGAAYLLAVLLTKTTYVSTFGYYMLIEIAFLFALYAEPVGRKSLFRYLTLSTYSVLGVAVIVAILALFAVLGDGDCDCDCDLSPCAEGADCCDCFDCSDLNAKRKKKK